MLKLSFSREFSWIENSQVEVLFLKHLEGTTGSVSLVSSSVSLPPLV